MLGVSDGPAMPATMAVGQHIVYAGKSIPVPTSNCPQADESIPMQKWNSLHGRQVHYTDAAAGASNDCGWSSAV